MNDTQPKLEKWSWWYLLFLIQFIAVLSPPSGYTALYTVILNLIVTIVLTPLLNSMHAAAVDETVAADYRAQ